MRPQTSSAEAYRFYLIGRKAFMKGDYPTTREWYQKAIAADSNFFTPRWELSWAYGNQGMVDSCLKIVLENYRRIDQLSFLDQLFAKWSYVNYFEPPEVGTSVLRQILEIDDQSPIMHMTLGEYEKAYQILRKWGKQFLKNNGVYEGLIKGYLATNQLGKAKKLLKEAEHLNPDMAYIPNLKIYIAMAEKDTAAIIRHFKESQAFGKTHHNFSKADSIEDIGWLYSFLCNDDSLGVYYRKALEVDPDNYQRLLRFVTVIEERRKPENFDFDEYSKLIDKMMELTKDRITYNDLLDRKGWTYYKKGRPEEALKILQRVWDEAPYKFYWIKTHYEEVKKAVGDR